MPLLLLACALQQTFVNPLSAASTCLLSMPYTQYTLFGHLLAGIPESWGLGEALDHLYKHIA